MDGKSLYRKITSKEYIFLVAVLMITFGSWLNAQGGWVKDFSYNRTVVLPFLFKNYYTSGFDWYLIGIFDDLAGLSLNILGFLILRESGMFSKASRFSRRTFIVPVVVYLVFDLLAFLNFASYYSGSTTLSDYGLYWNIIQYFAMLPALFAADISIIMSKSRN